MTNELLMKEKSGNLGTQFLGKQTKQQKNGIERKRKKIMNKIVDIQRII